ncbi:MAG: arginase family protein, partial [Armatimonadota bacterium]
VVVFGYRDEDEYTAAGSQDIRASDMHLFPLVRIREVGVVAAVDAGLQALSRQALDGFWIHLDVDVLHDDEMPAVDYRLPGGLRFFELREALRLLHLSGRTVGMDVTIFNPLLDADGHLSHELVRCIAGGLR